MVSGPLRHLGKLGCVRSDPYEPTSTGIGVGRGGAATHLCVEITSFRVEYVDARTVKMSSIQYRNLDL